MTRETALRLVRKLRALEADAAATPNEASVARAKADRLVARFGLGEAATRPAPTPRPRRAHAAHAAGSPFRVEWGVFDFDPSTGRGGSGVIVHEYRDAANWRVEIPLNRPPEPAPVGRILGGSRGKRRPDSP